MNENNEVALHQYWNIFIRRKWLILGSIFLSLAIAGALCKVLPKNYRSSAVILVEEQKIPEYYVRGVDEAGIEERIFQIQQQIMSRTFLGEIIKEFKLYQEEIEQGGLETAIDKIRRSLNIELIKIAMTEAQLAQIETKRQRGLKVGINAFEISFSHADPLTAMKVTSRIASKFIEDNLNTREQLAEGATQFLDSELTRAKADVERKGEEIRQFKSQHMGELPEQMEANLRALDRLQNELNTATEAIQRSTDRLTLIDKGIREYQMTGNTTLDLAASYGQPHPLIRRLRELEEKLATLSAEYNDSYPDIISIKHEIDGIKAKLVKIYGPEAATLGEKPFDPYLRELNKQRDELGGEIALLKKRLQLLTKEKKEYEQRVEKAPASEQELSILQRDYENMQQNYRSLLDKRLNARIAENLERRQKGQQLRLIEPANLPTKPDRPNQIMIMMLGLVFGCGAGFGLAYLLEAFNTTFRRPEEVERIFGPQRVTVISDFTWAYRRSSLQRFLPVPDRQAGLLLEHDQGPKAVYTNSKGVIGSNGEYSTLEMNVVARCLPASIVAEQYRVAATQLSILGAENKSTIVAVSSAIQGEGKTTTVVNLAYTFARDLGKRTLMVECDFKCPTLHRHTQIPSEPGLSDLLNEKVPLEACLHSFGGVPCWVMPIGGSRNGSNELIKSQRLLMILTGLRERFDYILMNTPAILPVADMNVLVGLADLLLLVVRAGSTPQQVVKRALSTLRVSNPDFMILNAVKTRELPSYMQYGYQYKNPDEPHA